MNNQDKHPEELLAWYVNGTLTGNEYEQVAEHIKACKKCQQDIDLFNHIQEQTKLMVVDSHGELPWARLQREIKKEEPKDELGTKGNWWGKVAAIAAVLVLTVQVGVIFKYSEQPEYIPAGEEAAHIQIIFETTAREEAIRKILLDNDLEIVSGPGASGVYRLRVISDENISEVQKIVERLKSKEDIVIFVTEVGD